MKLLKKHFHLALFRHSRTQTCNCTTSATKNRSSNYVARKKKRKHLRYDASRNVNARIGATDAELYTLDVRYLYY